MLIFNALMLAESLGNTLNRWPSGLGFKQLPRNLANLNA